MADASLSVVLEQFSATVQRGKGRMIAIPADKQRKLGLTARRDNHLLRYSIRKRGSGRWNHHYAKLTSDNEIALPSDLPVEPGDEVEVKVHRIIADVPVPVPEARTGGSILVDLAEQAMSDDSSRGADEHDAVLNEEALAGAVPGSKRAK
jgi:hypothetical protein